MKDSWDWDEDYLLSMIQSGTQESIALDFKRSEALQNTDGKKNELSKDVSAFANSAGGTLIYGMCEDGYIAIGLDAGVDPKEITKEWLEQVITSRIQPRIDNVRINQIYLHQKSPGRVAYVISVPASKGNAHQASDKRFYKRFNFKSEPMEEYEIRDLYRRGETPDLRMGFVLLSIKNYVQGPPTDQPFFLRPYITNNAIEPANHAVIDILIDARLSIKDAQGLSIIPNMEFSINDNVTHPVNILRSYWSVPPRLPIFQAQFDVTSSPIKLEIVPERRRLKQRYLLGYQIQAPYMPMKSAYTQLTSQLAFVKLSDKYLSGEELVSNYDEIEWE